MEKADNRAVWLSDKDLSQRYGVARITVWRWARQSSFPQPRKIAPNTTRWLASEIEAYDRMISEAV